MSNIRTIWFGVLASLAAVVVASSPAAAQAQTISIVTAPNGSFTNLAGAGMAKFFNEKTNIHAVLQAQDQQGMSAVHANTAEFGKGNAFDAISMLS
jgi:TRAP-type uncharacterized transport system substrate-binding protein